MTELKDIVREEIYKYAGNGVNCVLYPLLDDERENYGVIASDNPLCQQRPGVVVFARINGNRVVIEEDRTRRTLIASLLKRGIPREQIVLAYEGEPVPLPQSLPVQEVCGCG